jgi:hypothetical protein
MMVTGGLSRVLLGVGGSSFRGEVILPVLKMGKDKWLRYNK